MKFPAQQDGFTMFEVVVMLAIIAAISSIVLVSFGGLNANAALHRAAREVALSLRRAQNMSLAVTGIRSNTGALVLPQAVGVRFDLNNPGSYEIFADINLDGKWKSTDDIQITGREALTFLRNVKIKGFESCPSGPCPSVLHVIFAAPEATMLLTDQNGSDIGDRVDIRFAQPNETDTRLITVRTNGQISIK